MPNRLAASSSPYLRMHADDPVDWHPWGPDAFELARTTGRPVLLSAGYASCHWCHVMHRESFQDKKVAAYLNDHFVCVKVDREVRPDVDELYMAYVVAAAGHGGWPLTVVLTPELAPFFGGTYFPSEPRPGAVSFSEMLAKVVSVWESDRAAVLESAEGALGYLRVMFAPASPGVLSAGLVDTAVQAVLSASDPLNGGFGGAPKFPQHTTDGFLLSYYTRTREKRSLEAVEAELEGILHGGIYDQVGGGIARYSVDEAWLVPHFEKMLYDNALLLSTLARAHELRPRPEWERAIRQTAEFLDRDLSASDGFFASSRSADTDGVEGATYTWTWDELSEVLDSDELALAEQEFGATPEGNWEGTNILTQAPVGEQSIANRDSHADTEAVLRKLLAAREKRPQPALDEKVIVSWNALAARAFMDAGASLRDDALTRRGVSLVRSLVAEARTDDGGIAHVIGPSDDAGGRLIEDPITLAAAALRAHELSRDKGWLDAAQELFGYARDEFFENGTWFMVPADTELPVRPRERHDGPAPTGAHLAVLVAIDLAERSRDATYLDLARQTLERAVPLVQRSPLAAGTALEGILELLSAE